MEYLATYLLDKRSKKDYNIFEILSSHLLNKDKKVRISYYDY